MNISFQGFQPGLPISIYVILLLTALVLSWWSYRKFETIPAVARYGLMGLRGLVFFILLALLMNPLFRSQTVQTIKPQISVLLDDSRSVSITKGEYEGKTTYRNILDKLNFANQTTPKFSFFGFNEDVFPVNPDTLSMEGAETNLYAALDHVDRTSDKRKAALLLTDGIYTAGKNPAYLSRQLDIPLFVIGLGDTVSVRDLVVKRVVSSRKGYTRTEHTVETSIINDGFKGEKVTVQLKSDNQVIAQQTVTPTNKKSAHELTFKIPLQDPGLHQYEIFIPEKASEWTAANNTKTFSIDVRSNRDRVMHIAFEIHPDVKSIRSILATDKNISLTARTWSGSQNFLEGPIPTKADTFDLLILHGYPQRGIPSKVHDRVISLSKKLPIVFLRTPKLAIRSIPSSLQSLLPVKTSASPSVLQTGIYPVESQADHSIMDLPEIAYSELPSIRAPIRNIKTGSASTPLLNVTYQGSKTNVPFLAIQQLGNKRTSIINGFGFYRMKQSYEKHTRTYITRLLHNLVAWNAADTKDKLLQVNPVQQVFDGDDQVQLNAFLRNESGQLESDASVDIVLKNKAIGIKQYTMKNEGNGQYSLNLGTFAEGIYKFRAKATKGKRTIDTYQGEFSVSPTRIEYVNTTRNQQLLTQLAQNTGGKFYPFNQVDSVWHHMKKAGVFNKTKKTISTQFYPYQHAFWFITVIVLLGLEWLLRKYFALP